MPRALTRGTARKLGRKIPGSARSVHPHGRIVVVVWVELRVDLVPIAVQQSAHHLQAVAQGAEAAGVQRRLGQEHRDTQILGPGEKLQGAALDFAPVGRLGLDLGVADFLLGLALGGPFQLAVGGIVLQVLAAGCLGGNLAQKLLDIDRGHRRNPLPSS
jgi:hypothetical protein